MSGRVRFLLQVMWQELCLLPKQRTVLMILLGIPLVYPLLVSYLYAQDQVVERPALVVDADNSALSRRWTLGLDATQAIRVLDRVASVDVGFEALRSAQAELLVYIPNGFSQSVKKRERATVKIWINGANMLTYGTAYPAVYEVTAAVNQKLAQRYWSSFGSDSQRAQMKSQPITVDLRALYHPTGSYGSFLVPGVLMIVIQQLVLIGLAFAVGFKRDQNLLDRAQRHSFTFFTGLSLAQMVCYLAGISFIVFVVYPLFGWPMQNAGSLFVLFVVFMLAMIPIGILIASLVRDRYAAFELLMFVSIPLLMMSGFAMPSDQLPPYLQGIASLFPATPALQALRILYTKTGNLGAVTGYLGWLLLQMVVYFLLAFVLVKRPLSRRLSWTKIQNESV